MRITATSILTALLILGAVPSFGAGTIVVQDLFDDDTVGQAPGPPEIGTSFYNQGTHAVINDYASKSLRSVDNTTSSGWTISWTPTYAPAVAEADYLHLIESATGTGSFLVQQLVLSTAGSPALVRFSWKQGGAVELLTDAGAVIPTFTWTSGTLYTVRLRADCTTDTASLWIDGAPLVAGHPLGVDCSAVDHFSESSDFLGTISRSLDELTVVDLTPPFFADDFESGGTAAWSSTVPPLSAGDTCDQARSYTSGTLTGDLSDNSASGVSDSCGSGNTIDEWVSYTAPCTGSVTVTTCHPGTTIDSVVSAWSGVTCGAATETACNDDAVGAPAACDLSGSNRKSKATFAVTSGDSLYFRVSAFNDAVLGAYEISASCSP